tara:strand:- start:292 stop:453 length:162 start_codon:yes stop_codon:yes gene_type:complete
MSSHIWVDMLPVGMCDFVTNDVMRSAIRDLSTCMAVVEVGSAKVDMIVAEDDL